MICSGSEPLKMDFDFMQFSDFGAIHVNNEVLSQSTVVLIVWINRALDTYICREHKIDLQGIMWSMAYTRINTKEKQVSKGDDDGLEQYPWCISEG